MENKPKMILEMDEYEKIIKNSKIDAKMVVCLFTFLQKCINYGGDPLLDKLQDLMTEAGYSLKYNNYNGEIKFGDGAKIFLINENLEITNG